MHCLSMFFTVMTSLCFSAHCLAIQSMFNVWQMQWNTMTNGCFHTVSILARAKIASFKFKDMAARIAMEAELELRDMVARFELDFRNPPLQNLLLTDFSREFEEESDEEEIDNMHPDNLMRFRFRRNVLHLKALGARTPIFGISGFKANPGAEHRDFTQILDEGCQYRLVFWGSPYWANQEGQPRFANRNDEFKTNAFYSMCWYAPKAAVFMTFSEDYEVEFYNPYYGMHSEDGFADRELRVCEMYSRGYFPMVSGMDGRNVRPHSRTMVAASVPKEFIQYVTYVSGKLDVGTTMLNILLSFGQTDRAIELGGGVFDLSYELVRALHPCLRHSLTALV